MLLIKQNWKLPFHLILVISNLISTVGERLSFAALLVLAAQSQHATNGPAFVLIIYTLGFVVSGPLTYLITDNFSKKSALILSDFIRAVIVLGYIAIFKYSQHLDNSHLYLYALISLVIFFSCVARSTYWSIIPDTVPTERVAFVNTFTAINNELGLAIGTALGGFLVSSYSPSHAFFLDSLSYLISLSLLTLIPNTGRKVAHETLKLSQKVNKYKVELRSASILIPTILLFLTSFGIGFLNSRMISRTTNFFHRPESFIGYVFSIWAAGGLIYGVIFSAKKKSTIALNSLFIRLGLFLLTIFISTQTKTEFEFFSSLVICGYFSTELSSKLNTILMEKCPYEIRTSLSTAVLSVNRLAMFLGILMNLFTKPQIIH